MPLYKPEIFLFFLFFPSSLNLPVRFSLFLSPKFQRTWRLTLFWRSTFLWFGFCKQCGAFDLKTRNILYQATVLCCFRSCRPRLSLAEILLFFFVSPSHIYVVAVVSIHRTSKPVSDVNFVLFLTSTWLRFLRLNLWTSKFFAACLVTDSRSLTFFLPPGSVQYHSELFWNTVHLVSPNVISYSRLTHITLNLLHIFFQNSF